MEGKDFQILSKFASKIGARSVALRADFAVVPAEGYNATRVKSFTDGVKSALGEYLLTAVVFDRDYRSEKEISNDISSLKKVAHFVHIHSCKEIENFLFMPDALHRAICNQINDRRIRSDKCVEFSESIETLLTNLTDGMKDHLFGQWHRQRSQSIKQIDRNLDDTTISSRVFQEFNSAWVSLESRLKLVPGKELHAKLNTHIQYHYGVTITANAIIEAMEPGKIPEEICTIIRGLESFSKQSSQ